MSNSNKSNNVGKRLRQSSLLETFSFLKKKKLSSDSEARMSEEASQEVTKSAMSTSEVSSKGNEDLLSDKYESGSASCSKNNLSDTKNEREDCNNSDVSNASIDIFSEPESPQTLDVANSNQNTISNISKPQISIGNLALNRIPHCSKPLPTLWSSSEHLVLFNCNSTPGAPVRPYPINYKDAWNNKHVRLPCSPASLYPVKNQETGDEELLSRWEIIEKSLLAPISNSFDLQDAILSYNSQYSTWWNFQDLHKFFTDILEPEENNAFFEHLMPKMVRLALRMPELCTNPIPLLRKDYNQSITMSQSQIGCLLANAFFCTYPRRNAQSRNPQNRNTEYSSYPDINFNRLFVNSRISYRSEKFKCLFNYFKRITSNEPVGIVTFERRHSRLTPRWIESNRKLTNLYMRNEGTIEKEGAGLLQVDFANKFVGGGVLGHGCVQEEIRFLICPELIVSRLFTECLNENEVLVITGCEQYNSYSGYSDTFKWEGDFRDETPRDSWGRRCTQLLAMDALHFWSKKVQYETKMLVRELNKAFSGFYEPASKDNLSAIATGNWGCGAFNGEARLKLLLQLLAASEADRDLVYFTFSDENLMSDAEALYDYLVQRDMTVSKLFKILLDYSKYLVTEGPHKTLYAFIYDHDGEGASDCTLDLDSNDLEDFC